MQTYRSAQVHDRSAKLGRPLTTGSCLFWEIAALTLISSAPTRRPDRESRFDTREVQLCSWSTSTGAHAAHVSGGSDKTMHVHVRIHEGLHQNGPRRQQHILPIGLLLHPQVSTASVQHPRSCQIRLTRSIMSHTLDLFTQRRLSSATPN